MAEQAPDNMRVSAIAGVGLGASAFVLPALLMGWLDASLLYLLLWAMAWAPLLSWLPGQSETSRGNWIARQVGALIISTLLAGIILGGLYAIGSFAADVLDHQLP